MSYGDPGQMLVVDAGCIYEVLARTPTANPIQQRMAADPDHAVPHVVDVEVLGVIRRHYLAGLLDATAAFLAIEGLRQWPAERYGHRPLLLRAWELRGNVRGWDAMYVALAEALRATLLTTDVRLASAAGIQCRVEVPAQGA